MGQKVATVVRRTARNATKQGMHLRAAAALVQLALTFAADVTLESSGARVNGKSIMGVLSLAAPCGAEIVVCATGDDAAGAVAAIVALIERGFTGD